jgi:hypothetical protein
MAHLLSAAGELCRQERDPDGVIRIVPIDAAARPGAVAVAEVDPADPFARGLGVVP